MVKHIVMWKLKAQAAGNNKTANAQIMKDQLESLIDKISLIKKIEVGINKNTSESAYDVSLYSEFENFTDLEAYLKHPKHLEIGTFVSKIRESRVVVDYEI